MTNISLAIFLVILFALVVSWMLKSSTTEIDLGKDLMESIKEHFRMEGR